MVACAVARGGACADRVARTPAYVDPLHHASRVITPTQLSVGDPSTVGGPEWLQPLADALGGPVEQYALTHEGKTDHDALDAWLAGRLGDYTPTDN